jgi:hypothetical protein
MAECKDEYQRVGGRPNVGTAEGSIERWEGNLGKTWRMIYACGSIGANELSNRPGWSQTNDLLNENYDLNELHECSYSPFVR